MLFLVDRGNLGKQAEDEFANFEPSDDPRKFPTLYTVHRLRSNAINPAAKVVITTIQRLYSISSLSTNAIVPSTSSGARCCSTSISQDLTYTANQIDRDVVSESQIRTVLQQFRDKVLPDAFPGRAEVPKTLIFAKDDSHADDIVRLAREVFAQGNDFCQKITYRTGFTKVIKTVRNDDGSESEVSEWVKTASLTPDEVLANFRNSFFPRIAVTVDMISTGTDVKRGVRVISPDKLRVVTPSARAKDRFVIVDAVGVCERDKTDSRSLNRQHAATCSRGTRWPYRPWPQPPPSSGAPSRRRSLTSRRRSGR